MPELPEVEVVRLGLESHIVGTTIESVEVLHPRAVRRHIAGGKDLEGQLRGCTIAAAQRRGKYLWLPLESRDRAIVVHLGMSGQMLVQLTPGCNSQAATRAGGGGHETLRRMSISSDSARCLLSRSSPRPEACT